MSTQSQRIENEENREPVASEGEPGLHGQEDDRQREPGRRGGKGKWRRPKIYICATCSQEAPFCWSCPCGFMICSDCMEENYWGMTCNGVNWTCPDCGAIRSFGND